VTGLRTADWAQTTRHVVWGGRYVFLLLLSKEETIHFGVIKGQAIQQRYMNITLQVMYMSFLLSFYFTNIIYFRFIYDAACYDGRNWAYDSQLGPNDVRTDGTVLAQVYFFLYHPFFLLTYSYLL
jgi:hypothetical protein